jgi:hypothetical protein
MWQAQYLLSERAVKYRAQQLREQVGWSCSRRVTWLDLLSPSVLCAHAEISVRFLSDYMQFRILFILVLAYFLNKNVNINAFGSRTYLICNKIRYRSKCNTIIQNSGNRAEPFELKPHWKGTFLSDIHYFLFLNFSLVDNTVQQILIESFLHSFWHNMIKYYHIKYIAPVSEISALYCNTKIRVWRCNNLFQKHLM